MEPTRTAAHGVVTELDAASAADRERFVALGLAVAAEHELAIPEDPAGTEAILSGASAFTAEVDCQPLVAGDGDGVARCAAFVNRQYQADRGEAAGFVGLLAAHPGAAAAVAAMLERAERWLAERGVTRVVAPVDGSPMLGGALLTDDFDRHPMFPFAWNPPYYPDYLAAAGYAPAYPMLFYSIDLRAPAYREAAARAGERARCAVRPVDTGRWEEELRLVGELMNASFADPLHWELHGMTDAQRAELFAGIEERLDPSLMFFAEVDGEPVGGTYGLLDWTPAIHAEATGRELPAGWRPGRGGLYWIAVRPECRGRGVAAALAAALFRRFEELGLDECLYYDVNAANTASRGFVESFGGRGRVLYHGYDKRLPG